MEKALTVAQFLSIAIAISGKTQKQIADEAGFPKQNMIVNLKKGWTKVPVERVGRLARSLGVDPKEFMSRVLREYKPETWAVLREVYGLPDAPSGISH